MPDMRTCYDCKKSKPVGDFETGRNQCRDCYNRYKREYRKAHPDWRTSRSHTDERMKRTAKALGIPAEEFAIARMMPCGACGQEATEEKPNTGLAHPQTGQFAGTVCLSCAKGFAFLKKDPATLTRLLDMLS